LQSVAGRDVAGVAQAARELTLRANYFPAGNRTVRQLLFVRGKSKGATPGILVHDLRALYGES
jgi:hypothetical protein